jgi:hypothetical protein
VVHPLLPLSIKVWKVSFRSMISPYYEVLTDKCRHISIILAWFPLRFECSGQCFSMYGSQIQTWVTKLLWEQFCESNYYYLALLGKYIKSHIFCECNHVYWHCSNVRFITMVHVYIKEIQSPFITRGASLSTKSYQTSQTKLPFFFFLPKLFYDSQNVHNFRNTL